MQLSAIKVNPKNPRLIKDAKADKLMQSLLVFPEMLSLRPIIVDKKGFALGGNMRLLTIGRIVALTDAEFQEACIKYSASPANVKTWQEVRDSKQIPDAWVLKADKLTPEQQREFVIKDNVSGGEWDWDVLANEWESDELGGWGILTPDKKETPRDKIAKDMAEITDQNCQYPIVPEFMETHECFIISIDNQIDENFIRNLFDLNKLFQSPDGKQRKANVITIENVRKAFHNSAD